MSSRKPRTVKRARLGRKAKGYITEDDTPVIPPSFSPAVSPTLSSPTLAHNVPPAVVSLSTKPTITTIPDELATKIVTYAVCGEKKAPRSQLVQSCKFLRDVATSAPVARAFVMCHWTDPVSAIVDMDLKRGAMKKGRGNHVLDVMEHAASLIDYQNEGHWVLLNRHTTGFSAGLAKLAYLGHAPNRLNLTLLVLLGSIKLYSAGVFSTKLQEYLKTLKTLRGSPLYNR